MLMWERQTDRQRDRQSKWGWWVGCPSRKLATDNPVYDVFRGRKSKNAEVCGIWERKKKKPKQQSNNQTMTNNKHRQSLFDFDRFVAASMHWEKTRESTLDVCRSWCCVVLYCIVLCCVGVTFGDELHDQRLRRDSQSKRGISVQLVSFFSNAHSLPTVPAQLGQGAFRFQVHNSLINDF